MENNWMTIASYILAIVLPTVMVGGFTVLLIGLYRIDKKK